MISLSKRDALNLVKVLTCCNHVAETTGVDVKGLRCQLEEFVLSGIDEVDHADDYRKAEDVAPDEDFDDDVATQCDDDECPHCNPEQKAKCDLKAAFSCVFEQLHPLSPLKVQTDLGELLQLEFDAADGECCVVLYKKSLSDIDSTIANVCHLKRAASSLTIHNDNGWHEFEVKRFPADWIKMISPGVVYNVIE